MCWKSEPESVSSFSLFYYTQVWHEKCLCFCIQTDEGQQGGSCLFLRLPSFNTGFKKLAMNTFMPNGYIETSESSAVVKYNMIFYTLIRVFP